MRKKRKSGDGGFNVWRSYSDVMAGVLLLFILIMSLTLFQAQKSYDESIQERDEKLALQAEYTADLLAKQNTIEEQEGTIKTKDEKLTALAQTLAEQEAKLKEQQALLNQQQTDLDEKTTQLSEQQTKIDNIIGVKAEVVEALQKEFQKNNINVNLDSQTGALTLDASVLFDVDESELTDAGKEALRNVLPIYCKVLMEDTYKNYLAEIIIDGYTDTDGDYAYNLELSQQRSLAVAQYLLDIQGEFLTEDQSLNLQDYLTVNGHSMANPILDADGNVDKEASRRVEVKFRLKDDEMIEELSKIMAGSEESAADTATDDTATDTSGTDTSEADTQSSDDGSDNGNGETAAANAVTGYYASIGVKYDATYEGLKDMLAYVNEYSDRITITDFSSSMDSETGRLTGDMTFNMYVITNTGKDYVEPKFDIMLKGVQNIFGGNAGASANN